MPIPALKVAHVALSLDVGGLERNIVNQVRQAPALDQQISVICLERPGTLAPTAESLGATIRCTDKRPGLRLDILPRLRKIIRQLKPDIIHTHQIGPLFYTRLAATGLRIPIVHTEHGREPYESGAKFRALSRFAARSARIFYCLTEDMKKHVLAHRITSSDKIRVIHNGIDFTPYTTPHDTAAVRAQLNIPHDAVVIGTIGRLNEIKRQDVLLKAFATVRATIPGAHLLLVGDGPLKSDLESLAQQLNIKHHIHFAGYQSNTAPYMQAMNLFTLTSRSEGMPQSILEACVAGIPVIASNVGGIPEVIRHNQTGLLFPAGDDQALARNIINLLENPVEASRLATAAKAYVESTFDIRRMAREYHHHFLDLLGRPPVVSSTSPLRNAAHLADNAPVSLTSGA
ncbi:MAG TPA: glycosyltransferase [Tepidisphaeraceae bacterium]|jgi:glycosyltransferase involved in cell wall biosynthesis